MAIILPYDMKVSACCMCGSRFPTPQAMERHVSVCLRKHRDEIEGHDHERQQNVFTGRVDPEHDRWLRENAAKVGA